MYVCIYIYICIHICVFCIYIYTDVSVGEEIDRYTRLDSSDLRLLRLNLRLSLEAKILTPRKGIDFGLLAQGANQKNMRIWCLCLC